MKTIRNLLLALAGVCFFSCAQAQTINLDGSFDDWSSIKPAVTDPADAPRNSFVDFAAVSANADGEFVHLLIDFGKPVNIQRLPGAIYIMLDVDGDAATGREMFDLPGADLAVMLTAPYASRPGQPGGGISIESATWEPTGDDVHKPTGMISPYRVGFTFAPTYQSRTVEMRLQRGAELPQTPILFTGNRFGFALVAMDENRNILDQTKPAYFDLPSLEHAPKTLAVSREQSNQSDANPLAKPASADIRALTWNVEFNSLLERPQPFIPILRALDADILLFQELSDKASAADLTRLLQDNLPAGEKPWTVIIGAGGGNLRCAVASRLPMQPVAELDKLSFPNDANRTTRHAAGLITYRNHSLLATSIHLRCCGSADSREEEARLIETGALNVGVRNALKGSRNTAVLITGDFNLVGARRPLDRLINGLDVDRSDLEVADPFQLDGRSNATWADPDQPYVPGRLDYVLYSGAAMKQVGSFVFDSVDLPEAVGRKLGIDPEMSARASDHLPVVIDLAWSDDKR